MIYRSIFLFYESVFVSPGCSMTLSALTETRAPRGQAQPSAQQCPALKPDDAMPRRAVTHGTMHTAPAARQRSTSASLSRLNSCPAGRGALSAKRQEGASQGPHVCFTRGADEWQGGAGREAGGRRGNGSSGRRMCTRALGSPGRLAWRREAERPRGCSHDELG